MADVTNDRQLLLDGIRARLEMERWFGATHLSGGSTISRPQAESPIEAVPSAVATDTAEKVRRLAELEKVVIEDKRCPLHKTRTKVVFGEGNPDAGIMFIGEAPGYDEDMQGRPFVGRAGQLLTRIIEAMGMKREDVYIANILKCRPPENRTPSLTEIAACGRYVIEQIKIIRPRIIIALGGVAAKALLNSEASIGALRGRFHDYEGTKLLPTYHPAYLLRNPAAKAEVWEDMKKAMAELKKGDSGE